MNLHLNMAVRGRAARPALIACSTARPLPQARLFASDGPAAHDLFAEALRIAVRGEALRQEREAISALARASKLLYVSFTQARGAIAGVPLRAAHATLGDVLHECATTEGCADVCSFSRVSLRIVSGRWARARIMHRCAGVSANFIL